MKGQKSQKLLYSSSYQDSSSFFIKKLPANSAFQSYLFDYDEKGNYSYIRSNYYRTYGVNILKNDAYLENEYIKAYYNQGSDYPLAPANQDVVFYEAKQELIPSKPLADVFIPNAISPNGDGINDSLSLAPQDFKELHWQIFARNGTMVYEGSGAWNGSFKGKTQLGSYTYIFTATTLDGKEIKRKGSVRVIR